MTNYAELGPVSPEMVQEADACFSGYSGRYSEHLAAFLNRRLEALARVPAEPAPQPLKVFADKLADAIMARDFRDDWGPLDVQRSCSEMVHEVLAEREAEPAGKLARKDIFDAYFNTQEGSLQQPMTNERADAMADKLNAARGAGAGQGEQNFDEWWECVATKIVFRNAPHGFRGVAKEAWNAARGADGELRRLREALRSVNDLQHRMAIELDAIPQQPRIEHWTRQMEQVICAALAPASPAPTEERKP